MTVLREVEAGAATATLAALAQIVPNPEALLNLGGIAAVLGWLMLAVIPRLDRLDRTLSRMQRAMLLDVMSRTTRGSSAHREAQRMLREAGEDVADDDTGTRPE